MLFHFDHKYLAYMYCSEHKVEEIHFQNPAPERSTVYSIEYRRWILCNGSNLLLFTLSIHQKNESSQNYC